MKNNNDTLLRLTKLKKFFPLKRDGVIFKNKLFVRAVEDITIDIRKGETLGLVGESGCGKSTLGRTILQLYPVTSGSVVYNGVELERLNPRYLAKEYAKLPKYQDKAIKAYQKSLQVDAKLAPLKAQLAQDGNNEKLALKVKKLENKSLLLRQESSRQLREGARSGGSLVLEKDIKIISEKLHKTTVYIKQNSEMLNGIDQHYIKRMKQAKRLKKWNPEFEKQLNDWKAAELGKVNETVQKNQDEIDRLRNAAFAYKGKDTIKVHEQVDEDYIVKLDEYRETGVNLTKLTNEEMRHLRQKLQIIFQDPYSSLDSRMTVGQIISEAVNEHGLYKNNTPEMEAYVLDIMKKCGLDNYMIHRYPHQFSGGQRQRIGIARTLALQPEFIVCDEAVSALDVSIQSQILNLLHDLKKDNNLTYLFISHDLSVIKHISDRVGVMYLGVMVELADSEELYNNPLHPYTKTLISAIPSVDEVKKNRILPKGDIPSNIFPPSGCKFRTRCPLATEKCAQEVPKYREVKENHFVACHYYEKTKDL